MTQNAISPQAASILETMSEGPAGTTCANHIVVRLVVRARPGWTSLRQVVGSPSNTRAEMSMRGDLGEAGLAGLSCPYYNSISCSGACDKPRVPVENPRP